MPNNPKKNKGKPVKWVSDNYLASYYEVSRATIWRWTKMGRLPKPMKIGENCTRWDMDQVLDSDAKTIAPE